MCAAVTVPQQLRHSMCRTAWCTVYKVHVVTVVAITLCNDSDKRLRLALNVKKCSIAYLLHTQQSASGDCAAVPL
jgi:hypothetical protein